jgi:hypothetical protein
MRSYCMWIKSQRYHISILSLAQSTILKDEFKEQMHFRRSDVESPEFVGTEDFRSKLPSVFSLGYDAYLNQPF